MSQVRCGLCQVETGDFDAHEKSAQHQANLADPVMVADAQNQSRLHNLPWSGSMEDSGNGRKSQQVG